MGLTGKHSTYVTGNHTLRFEWTERSTNTSNNSSTVDWEMKFISDNYGDISVSGTHAWNVMVDGHPYSGDVNYSIGKNATITLASGTTTIYHDDDGSKTFSYSYSQKFGFTWGNIYRDSFGGSSTGELTTLARASDLSVSDGTLGVAQTVTVDRKSSGFVHTVKWTTASHGGTIAEKSSETSWIFTPPTEIADEIPNATTISMTFTLETYNGSTLIGSKSSNVTMSLPDNIAPVADAHFRDISPAYDELQKYLQSRSALAVKIYTSGSYGASIVSCKTEFEGNVYSGTEFTTSVIQGSGNVNVKVTVTDSRGRSITKNYTIEVQAYNVPRITLLTVHRCDQNGTENQSGHYASVTYRYEASENASLTVTLKYRPTNATSWTTQTLSQSANVENRVIFAADDGYAYEIVIEVGDAYGSSTRSTSLSTGYSIFHIPASGRGMSVGGVAREDGFNVMMDAHFYDGFTFDAISIDTGDCNRLRFRSGFYYIGKHGRHRPPSEVPGWLTVMVSPSGNVMQHYSTEDGQLWFRFYADGRWRGWCNYMTHFEM